MAGNIITAKENGKTKYDVYSFAALAAGNMLKIHNNIRIPVNLKCIEDRKSVV